MRESVICLCHYPGELLLDAVFQYAPDAMQTDSNRVRTELQFPAQLPTVSSAIVVGLNQLRVARGE